LFLQWNNAFRFASGPGVFFTTRTGAVGFVNNQFSNPEAAVRECLRRFFWRLLEMTIAALELKQHGGPYAHRSSDSVVPVAPTVTVRGIRADGFAQHIAVDLLEPGYDGSGLEASHPGEACR
jgi:hypothetical protein